MRWTRTGGLTRKRRRRREMVWVTLLLLLSWFWCWFRGWNEILWFWQTRNETRLVAWNGVQKKRQNLRMKLNKKRMHQLIKAIEKTQKHYFLVVDGWHWFANHKFSKDTDAKDHDASE
jgi:cell division protein FtsB